MDVRAELASAMKKRHAKLSGGDPSPKPTTQNTKPSMRGKPAVSKAEQASRSAAKNAAAAALAAKMSGRPAARSPAPAGGDGPYKTSVVAFSLSPEEEKIAVQYRKMVKLEIPEETVRLLMTSHGVSGKIQEAVLSGESPAAVSATTSTRSYGSTTRTSSLSPEEEKIATQYRKMIKLKMPEGAVRHKMTSHGVSAKVQEAVLSRESPAAVSATTSTRSYESTTRTSSLSPEEEKIATQYRKMIKLKMPEGAVRHKMTADGVSAKIQEAVLSGESPAVSAPAPTRSNGGTTRISSLSPEEEKIAAQYRKMIKLKMPEGAVRHKMTADGVSAKIQESVLGGETPAPPSSSSRPSKPAGNVSSLSREDEMVATPYRKMMKMKMPEGAVRHKMARDGVATHIQDSVIREEIPAEASASSVPPLPRANPMAAAIASSGGIGALKKAPVEKQAPAPAMPSNPLAAAIASSGGIGALKKAPVEKQAPAPAMPSNPLAAAIASSGGIGALKKAPVEKQAPAPAMPSNPLAAAIASSAGIGGLKKTSVEKKDPDEQKPASAGNRMLDELSSQGFQSGLKNTPLKPDTSTSN
eukprot:jgi/Psemu1/142950/gw1.8.129.1